MHFETVIKLTSLINSTNIFVFTFQSVQALTLAFILLKVIQEFVGTWDGGKVLSLGKYMQFFGTALLILSSSWIIDLGEEQLFIIDAKLNSLGQDQDIFLTVMSEQDKQMSQIKSDTGFFRKMWDFLAGDIIDTFYSMVMLSVGSLVAGFFKIADMVISMGLLIIRQFIVQFLKLTFPIAILFSVFDNTKSFFYSWVKRYVGVIVLGVAYIGVFFIIEALIKIMMAPSLDDPWFPVSELSNNAFITICVAYPLKFKLLTTVTSYVNSMFN
ncbi:type IV secretion system protein [Myroides odoratimimus]|uniref:type IV secretion system protein n=1 Tax=Myroides odoratimimus TaxID=76832 RepID=UPI0025780A9A|nr:type IV secretion system protein [Myroides odoratimimus]MDM1398864.1 type IV secretion system protein [Myroides odoratimimus]